MFSFRVTSIFDQEDLVLQRGRVGVVYDQTAWNPARNEYLYETFAKRGVLKKRFIVDSNGITPAISEENLYELDALVIEVQDLGCRYGSAPFMLQNLLELITDKNLQLALYIVDKTNPSGRQVEGTALRAGYRSSLGVEGIPHKYGLTIGELSYYLYNKIGAKFPLHIISYKATEENKILMPWSIPPSPDFAGLFTSSFFCGQYLWEGTNISCGKGTARPYEFWGAPFLTELFDNESLDEYTSPTHSIFDNGVIMKPSNFTPRYDKWAGLQCVGFQMLLRPNTQYHSLSHSLRIINFIRENCAEFKFNSNSKEGESILNSDKRPIELLLGDKELIDYIYGFTDWNRVKEHIKVEEQKWIKKSKKFILYENDNLFRIK